MSNLIKKTLAVLILALSTVFLNGCLGFGGDDDKTGDTKGLSMYEGGEFFINIDPNWKIINKADFYSDIPKETLVAFTAPEAFDGFFINVNIIKEDIKQKVPSVDYGRANINLAGQNLTDYQKIQEAEIDLNGRPALVHIFQARLNPTEKLIRFVQLYVTKERNGYIVSGGMLPDTPKELRDKVGSIVTSFRLR